MSYRHAIVYLGARDPALEALLEAVCQPVRHDDPEAFLLAVASAVADCVLVLADEDPGRLPWLIGATRAATRWGRPGLQHVIVAASVRPAANQIVQAFRRGCDGFIPLPGSSAQMLRALPEELRQRYREATSERPYDVGQDDAWASAPARARMP